MTDDAHSEPNQQPHSSPLNRYHHPCQACLSWNIPGDLPCTFLEAAVSLSRAGPLIGTFRSCDRRCAAFHLLPVGSASRPQPPLAPTATFHLGLFPSLHHRAHRGFMNNNLDNFTSFARGSGPRLHPQFDSPQPLRVGFMLGYSIYQCPVTPWRCLCCS